MQVDKSKTRVLGHGHSIEVGKSTWDDAETSVRNRYSTANGGFNQAGSSELPINDVFQIAKVTIEEDLLSPKILSELIGVISDSLKRQVK
jgi:hypothetical protein